jgi:O-antigen/teichoic acid export membrane protein
MARLDRWSTASFKKMLWQKTNVSLISGAKTCNLWRKDAQSLVQRRAPRTCRRDSGTNHAKNAWTIFLFWSPLALTWLMMASEGPALAAIVARLAEPKANLAAFGVSIAVAIIIEAPVIMIMSASTALARDRRSFMMLRSFTFLLNLAITLVMVFLLFTPAMGYLLRSLIGLPEEVAKLAENALILFLPWPAAIGYRRFYHGVLIRFGRTRLVACGTAIRLSSMTVTACLLYFNGTLPGASVAAASLATGVTVEAIAARLMAVGVVRRLLATESSPEAGQTPLTYREIIRFYFPLALTSTISLTMQPMVIFFVGKARSPLESLAVLPVVNALVFVFRAVGLSYQEAAIALIGDGDENRGIVRNFAFSLALATALGLGLIAWTPLSRIWFEDISGLTPALADFAIGPARILTPIVALSVLLSYQRAVLVTLRRTVPLTWSTVIEVTGAAAVLFITIKPFGMIGATAAAIALLAGRVLGNVYLIGPCVKRG